MTDSPMALGAPLGTPLTPPSPPLGESLPAGQAGSKVRGIENFTYDNVVTINAVALKRIQISWRNSNRFWKVLQSKSFGMIPPIQPFIDVLPGKLMRHMAVIASCGRVMA